MISNKSWKTTVAGVVAAGAGAVAVAPDMPEVVMSLSKLLSLVGVAFMGFFARDNDKSSEDVGAKK